MADLALQDLSITATSYGTDPDVLLGFEPDNILIINATSGTGDIIRVSFDGVNDHVTVVTKLNDVQPLNVKRTAIWLRRTTAGTSSVYVSANTVR